MLKLISILIIPFLFAFTSITGDKEKPSGCVPPPKNVLSKEFESNKGKLPFPASGFNHYEYVNSKSIRDSCAKYDEADQLEITFSKNANVKCIYEGNVVAITTILGQGQLIIVRHGEYCSAYTNITKVRVQKGDKVDHKTILGEIVPGKNPVKCIFMLYKGTTKINPEGWFFNK